MLIVSATAAATAASILLYIDNIAEALSHNDRLKNKVERVLRRPTEASRRTSSSSAPTNGPAPNSRKTPGRSDTTMLLRLDPDNNAIALMSIPRDLKAEIPGYGTGKFNEAYLLRRARS